ncbi:MAG: hypothetical protein WKF94_12300 [Solirubrobacteraceae bacterium]
MTTTRVHWPAALVVEALALAAAGASDSSVAAATGMPAATVRTYRRRPPRRVVRLLDGKPACSLCGGDEHDFGALEPATYAYLLGVYLGDGCLGQTARCYQLRIALDAAYPGIIEEVTAAVEAIRGRPPGQVGPRGHCACIDVVSGWKQWACYFPQHGPGRKHERPIELMDWQRVLVDQAPESFLRGLIHSDGCRTINRFKTRLPSGRIATYEYPRYFFSNLSPDILGLFADACDALGLRWTCSNHRNLSVSHRASVARME